MKSTAIFWGKVISGKKRGKSLGFPTANVNLHKKIKEGIYVSIAKVNKKKYQALTFVGSAKTFGESKVSAETYFLSFNGKLYGKWLSVRLLKKIRDNRKFKSTKELVKEMQKDKKQAEEYFKTQKHV